MPKQKKAENPRVILAKLKAERFSYRGIATALRLRLDVDVDYTLLCRIANDQRPCSDDLAEALTKLWRMVK